MTEVATVSLIVGGFFAVGDWASKLRGSKPLEYVCKPATLLALMAMAIALQPAADLGARRNWFVVALCFSLAGDVFLMAPNDLFVAGLSAFLVAHVFYVVGFLTKPPVAWALVISAIGVVVVVFPVARRVLQSLQQQPELRGPVALYIGVLSVMLMTALASGNVFAALGAALFALSDSMIAWDRFVRPFRAAALAIMVTYHLGQAGLVLSLLR